MTKSPVTIAMCTDALRWANDMGIYTDEELRGLANYLYWLCGKFGLEAQAIIGAGSGGGTVVPGGLVSSAVPVYFVVSASSLIVTGASSATLTQFIGYNLQMVRGGVPQSTLTTESTYFSWNRVTGAFTCSPALTVDEVISLIPV